MDLLLQTLTRLYEAMRDCLEREQHLASLILLYSGIDAVASVEAVAQQPVNEYFVKWVDAYLLPTKLVTCTALELYAARCGIVHTLRPESRISGRGQARLVYYAWGDHSADDLQGHIAHTAEQGRIVAVHIGRLLEAFQIALREWADSVSADPERLEAIDRQRARWFVNIRQA